MAFDHIVLPPPPIDFLDQPLVILVFNTDVSIKVNGSVTYHIINEGHAHVHAIVKGKEGRKEGNVLFNNVLNSFYLRLYGVGYMVKDYSKPAAGTTRVLLYAPSHRQDSTYHGLC